MSLHKYVPKTIMQLFSWKLLFHQHARNKLAFTGKKIKQEDNLAFSDQVSITAKMVEKQRIVETIINIKP